MSQQSYYDEITAKSSEPADKPEKGEASRQPLAGSSRLHILAASINEHLTAAEKATRRGLEHAIAAGLLLIEAKKLVGHGEWLAWLQANCQIGQRQAQTYMRLARNRHRFEAVKNAAAAHLTIAAAEALVGRPRPERPRGLPGQLDMLGGPEVTAPPPAISPVTCDRDRLVELIAAVDYAMTVITDAQQFGWPRATRTSNLRVRNEKVQSNLRAALRSLDTVASYLREQWRGLPRSEASSSCQSNSVQRRV
jgi:Protein of unknown function (DUF3102)